MKTAAFAMLLMATTGLLVLGCSDNSTPVVSPTDQSATVTGPLGKVEIREFTSTAGPDPAFVVLDPGFQKSADGKMVVRGLVEKSVFNATFADGETDLLSGNGVLELNYTVDLVAGEMMGWGKLTITPTAPEANGGVWEIGWKGPGWFVENVGWVTAAKMIGRGRGGAINGMQLNATLNLVTWEIPFGWTGTGNGCIKSH